MLDISHLPKSTPSNLDYFYNTGGTSSWVTWEKPRGIIMLEMICIGAGGGGSGGYCRNTNASRSGGAGGGSGGFTRLLIPSVFLPDVLYIFVGKGGAGGAASFVNVIAGGVGGAGSVSYVSIAPSTDAIYVACYANGGGGGQVAGTTGATAGTAAAIAAQTSAVMSGLGLFTALAGQAGSNGVVNATATAITYPTTGLLLSGGSGAGGGTTGVGGNITAPTQSSFSIFATRNGGTAGNPGTGGDGGLSLFQPLLFTGGSGGGTGNSIVAGANTAGGKGGNGGLGSGGGGGGSGQLVGGSGAGGDGGDGLIIIRSW
jgi:hypothetical protein